jgi:hypothetical protein
MVSKDVISILKLLHGSYNLLIFSGFIFQATMGLRIRNARIGGTPNPRIIKRHRKLGPVLAVLGILGGLSGPIITYLDKGKLIGFVLHFTGGMTVLILIVSVFTASRAIKGKERRPRTVHLSLGVLLLLAYVVQVILGLGIFL